MTLHPISSPGSPLLAVRPLLLGVLGSPGSVISAEACGPQSGVDRLGHEGDCWSWGHSPVWAAYSDEVKQFLMSFTSNPERMVLLAVIMGAVALFVITRGKWR